jgi:hypothetical protein
VTCFADAGVASRIRAVLIIRGINAPSSSRSASDSLLSSITRQFRQFSRYSAAYRRYYRSLYYRRLIGVPSSSRKRFFGGKKYGIVGFDQRVFLLSSVVEQKSVSTLIRPSDVRLLSKRDNRQNFVPSVSSGAVGRHVSAARLYYRRDKLQSRLIAKLITDDVATHSLAWARLLD